MQNAVKNYWELSYSTGDAGLFDRLSNNWEKESEFCDDFEYGGDSFERRTKGYTPELTLESVQVSREGLFLKKTPRETISGIDALNEGNVKAEFIEDIKKVYSYLGEEPPDGIDNNIKCQIIDA